MTVTPRPLVTRAAARLAEAGVESPRHDAEALLAHVLGTTRGGLLAGPSVDVAAAERFEELVRRRAGREPLQHLIGQAAFRHLVVEVGPGVFVPRPETEVMTETAILELQRLQAGGLRPRAVDLCTGSGAVALAMATEAPGARVTAVELSPKAHAYAVRNCAGHDIDVRLADMATGLTDLAGTVHLVAANPPYIPMTAYESVNREARDFDPALALWSGEDGLDAIRVVAEVAADLLVDGGLVLCEHADVQVDAAPEVFAGTGEWREVRDHLDLAGRPRYVTARRVPRGAPGAGTMSP